MSKFFGLFGCDSEMDDESAEEGECRDDEEDDDEDDEKVPVEGQAFCKELAIMELEMEKKPEALKEDEASRMNSLMGSKMCCICNCDDVKYRCPKCSLRTCSMNCCKEHKQVFSCNGVRDQCPFLKVSEFSDKNLVDDYFFLEQANNAIESAARRRRSICKSGMAQMGELPNWMKKLRYEARMRGTRIKFLPAGFKRRLRNHTAFMYREKVIEWTVEWVFALKPDDAFKMTEERVCENVLLIDHLASLIRNNNVIASKFDSQDLPQVDLFLRHESSRFCSSVDINNSLSKVLQGKSVLEFPTLVITLPQYRHYFPLLHHQILSQHSEQECTTDSLPAKKSKLTSQQPIE